MTEWTDEKLDATASLSMLLVDRLKPLIAGLGPAVQGAILVELVATFIAGHHPKLREESLRLFLDAVRELVPICERQMFEGRERPEGWTS